MLRIPRPSQTQPATTQFMLSELQLGLMGKFSHQEKTYAKCFSHSKCLGHLTSCLEIKLSYVENFLLQVSFAHA